MNAYNIRFSNAGVSQFVGHQRFPGASALQSPPAKPAVAFTLAIALMLAAGCASTKVSDRQQFVTGPIPRPNTIIVQDFAASAADVPADSSLKHDVIDPGSQTPDQIAEGHYLGQKIASELVDKIREMGMPAVLASTGVTPQLNDIVLRGYLVSVEQGNTGARMIVGFGAGNSEMETIVEGLQMTANGLQKLGQGKVSAEGSKGPGAGLGAIGWAVTGSPAGLIVSGGMKVYGEVSGRSTLDGRAKDTAKEIASVLKKRFQEQGWIAD